MWMFWRAVWSDSSTFTIELQSVSVSVVEGGQTFVDVMETIRARTISARREIENLASVSKTRAAAGLWVGVPLPVMQRARRW